MSDRQVCVCELISSSTVARADTQGSIFFAIAEKESTVRKRQHRFYSGLFKENRSGDINKFHQKIQ